MFAYHVRNYALAVRKIQQNVKSVLQVSLLAPKMVNAVTVISMRTKLDALNAKRQEKEQQPALNVVKDIDLISKQITVTHVKSQTVLLARMEPTNVLHVQVDICSIPRIRTVLIVVLIFITAKNARG